MLSQCDKMSQIDLDNGDTGHIWKLIVPGDDGKNRRRLYSR